MPTGDVVRVFAVTTGSCVFTLVGHTDRVSGVSLHPTDPSQVVTSSLDGTIRLWDVSDGSSLRTVHIGLPIVRLACPSGLPSAASPIVYVAAVGRYDAAAIDAAAAGSAAPKPASVIAGGSPAFPLGYPLGDEVAALRSNPLPTSYPFVVGLDGNRVKPPKHSLLEVSLSSFQPVKLLMSKNHFPTSLDARVVNSSSSSSNDSALGAGSSSSSSSSSSSKGSSGGGPLVDMVVVTTMGDKLYLWRSGLRPAAADSGPLQPPATAGYACRYAHVERLTCAALHPFEPYVTTGDTSGKLTSWFLPELTRGWTAPAMTSGAGGDSAGNGTVLDDEDGLDEAARAKRERKRQKRARKMAEYKAEAAKDEAAAEAEEADDEEEANAALPLALVAPPVATHSRAGLVLSQAHWHAHSVWAVAFAPDGSFCLSGGEEAVMCLWALEGRGSGPTRNKSTLTFLPRLGAPLRSLAAWASGGSSIGGHTNSAASSSSSSSSIQRVPALMFAAGCADNSCAVIDGVALRALWRSRGLAVAGLAAVPVSGVIASVAHGQVAAIAHKLREAAEAAEAAAAATGSSASGASSGSGAMVSLPLRLGPGAEAILLHSLTRYLRRGAVIDPRAQALVVNGLPGKGSLQWFDHRALAPLMSSSSSSSSQQQVLQLEGHLGELDVSSRNAVSRMDGAPPPPVRVTHVAFSSDGRDMATVEVAATMAPSEPSAGSSSSASSSSESITLKFWTWDGVKWALSTRVEAPHKTAVTSLEFHPTQRLALTSSGDRTFKLWERGDAGSSATAAGLSALVALGDEDGSGKPSSAPAQLTKSQQRKLKYNPRAQVGPRYVWSCRSVGFYRDAPATAGGFSSDGSVLAVAYGAGITLWDWRDNTLMRTLAHTSQAPAAAMTAEAANSSGKASGSPIPPVTTLFFAGLSPYLVTSTPSSLCVWDCLSCSPSWRYESDGIVAVAGDRIGLATSSRFAAVVKVDGNKDGATTTTDVIIRSALMTMAGLNSTKSTEPLNASSYFVVLWDAASGSPVPLAAWALPASPLAAAMPPSPLLPASTRPAPYSLLFVPPVASGGGGGAGDVRQSHGNDVIVLGPANEIYRFRAPDATKGTASAKGAAATTTSKEGGAVHVASSAGPAKAAKQQQQPQQKGAKAAAAGPVVVTGGAAASAGKGLSRMVATASSSQAAKGPSSSSSSSSSSAAAASSSSAFTSLLSSLGPTQALPQPDDLFASLMASLLLPAPPAASKAAANGSGPAMTSAAAAGAHESGRVSYGDDDEDDDNEEGAAGEKEAEVRSNKRKRPAAADEDDDDAAQWGLRVTSTSNAFALPSASSSSSFALPSAVLSVFGASQPQSALAASFTSSSSAAAAAPKSQEKQKQQAKAAAMTAEKAAKPAAVPTPKTPAAASSSAASSSQKQQKGAEQAASLSSAAAGAASGSKSLSRKERRRQLQAAGVSAATDGSADVDDSSATPAKAASSSTSAGDAGASASAAAPAPGSEGGGKLSRRQKRRLMAEGKLTKEEEADAAASDDDGVTGAPTTPAAAPAAVAAAAETENPPSGSGAAAASAPASGASGASTNSSTATGSKKRRRDQSAGSGSSIASPSASMTAPASSGAASAVGGSATSDVTGGGSAFSLVPVAVRATRPEQKQQQAEGDVLMSPAAAPSSSTFVSPAGQPTPAPAASASTSASSARGRRGRGASSASASAATPSASAAADTSFVSAVGEVEESAPASAPAVPVSSTPGRKRRAPSTASAASASAPGAAAPAVEPASSSAAAAPVSAETGGRVTRSRSRTLSNASDDVMTAAAALTSPAPGAPATGRKGRKAAGAAPALPTIEEEPAPAPAPAAHSAAPAASASDDKEEGASGSTSGAATPGSSNSGSGTGSAQGKGGRGRKSTGGKK